MVAQRGPFRMAKRPVSHHDTGRLAVPPRRGRNSLWHRWLGGTAPAAKKVYTGQSPRPGHLRWGLRHIMMAQPPLRIVTGSLLQANGYRDCISLSFL